jgi:hypothetical protein
MDWEDLRLTEHLATSGLRCRCGTRLSEGTPCYEFEGIPEALLTLLRDQAFCTTWCVRAFLLEAMEVLEGSGSPELISDVHSVYSYLQVMFALAQPGASPSTVPATASE